MLSSAFTCHWESKRSASFPLVNNQTSVLAFPLGAKTLRSWCCDSVAGTGEQRGLKARGTPAVSAVGTSPVEGAPVALQRDTAAETHFRSGSVLIAQACPTLCNPMGYTVHGILQARILEWVALPFSRGSSQPRDRTRVSYIAGRFFTS